MGPPGSSWAGRGLPRAPALGEAHVYDDWGRWAFAAAEGRAIAARFHEKGIVVAPENPDVGRDKRCREARERTLRATTLYCEWHGKLEPDRNRVHVHGPVPASGGKMIVAIFDDHLPLPGD